MWLFIAAVWLLSSTVKFHSSPWIYGEPFDSAIVRLFAFPLLVGTSFGGSVVLSMVREFSFGRRIRLGGKTLNLELGNLEVVRSSRTMKKWMGKIRWERVDRVRERGKSNKSGNGNWQWWCQKAITLLSKKQVPRGYNDAPSSVDRWTKSQTEKITLWPKTCSLINFYQNMKRWSESILWPLKKCFSTQGIQWRGQNVQKMTGLWTTGPRNEHFDGFSISATFLAYFASKMVLMTNNRS